MGTLRDYLKYRRRDAYYCPGCERTFNEAGVASEVNYHPYGSTFVPETLWRDVCPHCGEDAFYPNEYAWRGRLKGRFSVLKRCPTGY